MSPTRRDLFRRAAATVAAVSIAALPTVPVAVPAVNPVRGFASVVDTDSDIASKFGALTVMLCFHWPEWTPDRRARFVEVLDDALGREFPDLLDDTLALIERSEERRAA